MAISEVSTREKNIIKIEVNRLLKVLEKRLKLTGVSPKQRYRWNQKPIINIVVEQVGGALKIGEWRAACRPPTIYGESSK